MKRELLYEHHQKANGMEAKMVIVAGMAVMAAIFALASRSWMPSVGFLILGALAFALSRVFDLLGDLFAAIHSLEEKPISASRENIEEP